MATWLTRLIRLILVETTIKKSICMSLSVGGVSTNELLVGAAVIGGAYLLYQFKGASDDLAAVEDDNGCPDPSLGSVLGVVMEPWAYTKCAANTIKDIPFGQVAEDVVDVAQTVAVGIETVSTRVEQGYEVGIGMPIPFTPNVAVEANSSSDFQAWVAYANQLQANNPTAGITPGVDAYGCMDTRWLLPLPGAPAPAQKVCNDNSGCYASTFYQKAAKDDLSTTWSKLLGGTTSGDEDLTSFGQQLKGGAATCAVAADNGTLALLDYDAVKANPLAIPLPSDSPQSLQSAGFGISFENAANLLNKGYKMPAKSKLPTSAVITVGNINSLYTSNPMDNPSMPVPPGGWK